MLQTRPDLLQALGPRHGGQEERRLTPDLRRALRQQSLLQLSQLQASLSLFDRKLSIQN